MALAPGTRVGPYEVVAQIGAGGMGEVYRATDSSLGRQVAIKVLPDAVSSDAERLARFDREARTLAALNHANIATIHGLERSEGVTALVMELVEGPTLADRIAGGPIPLDETLPIARQIAEALEAAHEQGIVHRDLKPANIKLRPDGTVKVLDFGLAKMEQPAVSTSPGLTESPTITTPAMTQAGLILGTAAYMSPEQAKGRPADKRSDVWAFGAVLYEMLAGRRAFAGEDVSDTMASVLKGDTDWGALPASVPPRVVAVIRRCLQRDPRQRVADVQDARLALEGAFDANAPEATTSPRAGGRLWPWAVAAVASLTAIVAVWAPWRAEEARVPVRVRAIPPIAINLAAGRASYIAVSPDGRTVAIAGSGSAGSTQQLWLWHLDSLEATPLAGTGGASGAFWSPDSRSIAFTAGGALKRIDVAGGLPQTILASGANDAGLYSWGAWSPDGVVLFRDASNGFSRVPATGGEAIPVVAPGRTSNHFDLPVFLPDGVHFLYLDHSSSNEALNGIYVGSIDGTPDEQPVQVVLPARDGPLLVRDPREDHPRVVFWRDGSLVTQPFDVERLVPTGEVAVLASDVAGGAGNGRFSASADGRVLIYEAAVAGIGDRRTLAWVDRSGHEASIEMPTRPYVTVQLSNDGTRVALDPRDEERDVWIWNFRRQALQRATFDRANEGDPVWSPDGTRLAFKRVTEDGESIYTVAADGSGVPAPLTEPGDQNQTQSPSGFSPDGQTLLFTAFSGGSFDVWAVPTGGPPGAAKAFIAGRGHERHGVVSPDGRWVAYQSDESGRVEVHVRPFPDVESGHWQVSTDGGTRPRWSSTGREIFYYVGAGGTGAIWSVAIDAGPGRGFGYGRPQLLFRGNYPEFGTGPLYDVSPDGQRFLMIKSVAPENAEAGGFVVVQNAFEQAPR